MKAEAYALLTKRRLDWDKDEADTRNTRTLTDIKYAEFHHTGARGPKDLTDEEKTKWLLLIERYHEITQKWSDIFYHVFIFADGEIWQGRNWLRTSQANLAEVITIHFPGNDPVLTEAQIESAIKFLRVAGITECWDHATRPFQSGTSYCAGDNVRAVLPRIQKEIAQMSNTPQQPSSWAEAGIKYLANVEGDDGRSVTDGSRPHDAATRQEIAVMIARAVQALRREMPESISVPAHDAEAIADEVHATVMASLHDAKWQSTIETKLI